MKQLKQVYSVLPNYSGNYRNNSVNIILKCIIKKRRPQGKLVWFHVASVGELLSIIPLLEKLEKIKEIKLIVKDAKKEFISALKNVSDPEKKRKIIGNLFIKILIKLSIFWIYSI